MTMDKLIKIQIKNHFRLSLKINEISFNLCINNYWYDNIDEARIIHFLYKIKGD